MTLFDNKNALDKVLAEVASRARAGDRMVALADAIGHNEKLKKSPSSTKEPQTTI